jgi:TonB family protein
MHYNRVFDLSLLISITLHACLGLIFFFITFPHHTPIFKTIEISIVKLPEKKESKILKPKVAKRKVIGVVKKRPKLRPRKSPTPVKKAILPPKPKVVQEVKEVITPTTIPTIFGGVEKDEVHGKIHIAKATPDEGITPAKEGKTLQEGLIPKLDVAREEGKEESAGPYIYISGPASKRKALYQPKFKPPYWLERSGQSVHGKLKIWVLPDGSVDKVEIEESFGYAEIDRLARSTIYKWRFYKLPPNIKRVDWGIVTITIRLE